MRPGTLLLNKPSNRWWRGGECRVVEVPLGPYEGLQWVISEGLVGMGEPYNPLEEKPPAYLALARLGEKSLELRLGASLKRFRVVGKGIARPHPPLDIAPTDEEEKEFVAFTERYGPLWFPQTPGSWKYKRALPEPEPGYESHLARQNAGFPLSDAVDEAICMAVAVRCYEVIEGEGGSKASTTLRRWLQAIESSSSKFKQSILIHSEAAIQHREKALFSPLAHESDEDWQKYWEKALSSLLTTNQGLRDVAEDWLVAQLNSPSALGEISPRLETRAGFSRLLLRRRPDLVPKSEVEVKWRPTYWFDSLAGALWLQLFLVIVQGNPVRECLGCERLFEVMGRRDQVYCDHLCRGAANAKSYYQRKRGKKEGGDNEREHPQAG